MVVREESNFKYIETNPESKDVLLLLHGLFGALSNFQGIIGHFGQKYNVVVPIIPITELPLLSATLGGILEHVEKFLKFKKIQKVNVLGNSLGGHISLLYTLKNRDTVNSLILTGSSGLFEEAMGSSYPKRGTFEYIKNKTADTFYDPAVATDELVDEVFKTVNDRSKVLRILSTAKSAIRHNIGDKLSSIKCPTLLIWGNQDKVTPPFVAHKFHELIENSELHFLDKCGHAPMMELPDEFNVILEQFLNKHIK
ncbi:MAG: alpha/beta fold hydrolase [Saprospiraceae bacterium]|nr:alpha/beta fold hydrolase [Saprospiraceae bacterium]